jgi:hypothetical protein
MACGWRFLPKAARKAKRGKSQVSVIQIKDRNGPPKAKEKARRNRAKQLKSLSPILENLSGPSVHHLHHRPSDSHDDDQDNQPKSDRHCQRHKFLN